MTQLYNNILSSEPDSNDTIANLSSILDTSNDLTNVLDVPVCSDLNYEPFKFTENNNYSCVMGLTQIVTFIATYV